MSILITNHLPIRFDAFIFFQCTRLGSPNLDLGYYLFTSLKPEIRREKWQELLRFYFDEFRSNIKTLGGELPISFDVCTQLLKPMYTCVFKNLMFSMDDYTCIGFFAGISSRL